MVLGGCRSFLLLVTTTKHDLFAQRGQKRYFFGANTNLFTLDIN